MSTESEPGTELVVDERDEVEARDVRLIKSASDYREESIGNALDAAYAKASTLTLTADETKALEEDFPDEAFRRGAMGNQNLIYIEHAYLRQRLNKVLGVGASVPIRRREWNERFTYVDDNEQQREGVRVYVELVLIVRGCVVSEAIGDSVYYPHNLSTNYSDALESAKSNALRRCCKEFGIGLQAWMKGWVDGWKERSGGRQTATPPKSAPKQQSKPQTTSNKPAPFKPPADWPTTSHDELCKWAATLSTSHDFTEALKLVDSAKLAPTIMHANVKVVAERYHTALSGKSDPDRKKAEKFTKWIDDTLTAWAKADLEAQAKETFGGETFAPPAGWPDTPAADLVTWVSKLEAIAGIKTAFGMFVNEQSLQANLSDWETVLAAVTQRYKSITKNFSTNRDSDLEQLITDTINKLQADKAAADQSFNPPSTEGAT